MFQFNQILDKMCRVKRAPEETSNVSRRYFNHHLDTSPTSPKQTDPNGAQD